MYPFITPMKTGKLIKSHIHWTKRFWPWWQNADMVSPMTFCYGIMCSMKFMNHGEFWDHVERLVKVWVSLLKLSDREYIQFLCITQKFKPLNLNRIQCQDKGFWKWNWELYSEDGNVWWSLNFVFAKVLNLVNTAVMKKHVQAFLYSAPWQNTPSALHGCMFLNSWVE